MPLQARPFVPAGFTPIRITRPTVFRGKTVTPGDVFSDATGAEALLLIGCGKAERFTPPPEVPDRSQARSVDIEVSAAAPATEAAAIEHRPTPRRRARHT